MRAAALDRLKADGRFPTDQAIAILEAIDVEVSESHWVTKAHFDACFAQINARFDAIDARFYKTDQRADTMDDRLDRIEARLDKMDDRLDKMDARFDRLEARIQALETQLKSLKSQLIVIVITGMLGSQAISTLGPLLLNLLRAAH
jgi:septal ring factor EnvC (AmiA/AmiB activator)